MRTAKKPFHGCDPDNTLLIDDDGARSWEALSGEIEVSLEPSTSRFKAGYTSPV
jgi:hypothetical protein